MDLKFFIMFLEDYVISLIKWLPSVIIKPKWLFTVNLFILGNLNVQLCSMENFSVEMTAIIQYLTLQVSYINSLVDLFLASIFLIFIFTEYFYD